MKKTLILTIIFLAAPFLSKAQNPTVYQPDSVVYYINLAEYHFPDPIDSVGWMKFSYDGEGLLTHFRDEAFSENLWYYSDYSYEYDSHHNLTRANIRIDSHDAMFVTNWEDDYSYQDNNQLSTYAYYFYDPRVPLGHEPWSCQDSISYQYDALGRPSKIWEFCNSSLSLYTNYDYEYQDNEVIVMAQFRNGDFGEWTFLNKRTFLYSDSGKLLSCLLETAIDTCLTTYSYNEQDMICGILKQTLKNGEYVNSNRVVFELNEAGYPSVVSFEKWKNQWVEGCYQYSLPHLRNTDHIFIFSEDYLAQLNLRVLKSYVKRLEFYYSQTPKPNYDVMELNTPTAFATLHPNPTNGLVTIMGKDLKTAEVFNALGQHMANAKGDGEQLTVDISDLPAGVYFVNVTDGEGRKCVKKVVKE